MLTTDPRESTTQPVLVAREGGIGWVTLNRPRVLNAMNEPLMDGLREALAELARDPMIRCVVLRGAGRAFCAGGDVEMMARRREADNGRSTGALFDQMTRDLARRSEASVLLQTMPKPTLVAIHGYAVGGAVSLALAADLRLAARTARLKIGFASISLSGDYGIAYLLERSVGAARARELLLLDPVLEAEEALALGLVSRVVSDDEYEAEMHLLAEQLASGPTIAFARMKQNILAAQAAHSLPDALMGESVNQRISAMTSDAREAGAARAEGRAPEFRGE